MNFYHDNSHYHFTSMQDLKIIYKKYCTPGWQGWGDKGNYHTYIDKYAELLEPYRYNINFLEIGVMFGDSMKMWEEYFIDSKIIGIDINDDALKSTNKNFTFDFILGDATKPEILNHFDNLMFDVLIDDGSHIFEDQIKSFNIFKNKINKNGIYIVEDVDNIDNVKDTFINMHDNCEIIDNRSLRNIKDDVLVVYRF